jgi:NADH:ubiquinone oxidoreductase subunit E
MGIVPGETTEDMKFTLETVNCLGACALGPIVVVNGEYHGQMTTSKAAVLLKGIRKSDGRG